MFSIITPTYNRCHTLERVYNSMLNQTDQDFDWIIMDDASTDDTENLVNSWIGETNTFSIQYHKLSENKGKPYALNEGFKYCNRPITIIADSDDTFVPQTIAELKMLWKSVDLSRDAKKIATIWTLTDDEHGRLVGEPFPHNFWQVSYKERVLERKKQVAGEKWHSWRTEILKKYKMCYSSQSFIPEGATWKRINQDYDFLCVNIVHRKYFSSPDGLINKKKTKLEQQKIKYYNSYYQLYDVPCFSHITHPFYRRYSYEYLKASFYHKDKKVRLGIRKKLCCLIPAVLNIPKGIIGYIKAHSQ
ncbi:MAG: glycosyltransferase family 2 protein [Allomuricauda sp.]|uniref:glycosyltransferase family 2 protein n=1 Tax=Allomuricauda sp. ARW1Y1 TaxID=2663843 RepID=UPI0015CC7F56|nr:glycosyltransferase family 2 protein [Muricauda sp. ARW1Y1]NYJ28038.1 glycosyltransferase involved in cell wall biosynthesis [Muricauda sp. ARW1Y1]